MEEASPLLHTNKRTRPPVTVERREEESDEVERIERLVNGAGDLPRNGGAVVQPLTSPNDERLRDQQARISAAGITAKLMRVPLCNVATLEKFALHYLAANFAEGQRREQQEAAAASQPQFLSLSNRASTLNRAPPQQPEAAVVRGTLVRPPAPPVGHRLIQGALDGLQMRSMLMDEYASLYAQYHRFKTEEIARTSKQVLSTAPFNPYVLDKAHIAWSLTKAFGQFQPCSKGANCEGSSMRMPRPSHELFPLKQYVSPTVRAQYESTGVLPPINENKDPLLTICLLCYLREIMVLAGHAVGTRQIGIKFFPEFYNEGGVEGGYDASALINFSGSQLNGITRPFRYFAPEQFEPARVVVDTPYKAPGGVVLPRTSTVDGYKEKDFVFWRAESEIDPARTVSLIGARPYEPPTLNPPRAPTVAASRPTAAWINTSAPHDAPSVRAPISHLLRNPAPEHIKMTPIASTNEPPRDGVRGPSDLCASMREWTQFADQLTRPSASAMHIDDNNAAPVPKNGMRAAPPML